MGEDVFIDVLVDSPASSVSVGTADTSQLCKEASSEFALGTCSVPSGHAFVTAAVPEERLDWCGAIKVGGDMVVTLSFDAFARDKLLTRHLAGCAVLGMVAPVSRSGLVMSQRTSYGFFDSNTGGQWVEVIRARPKAGGGYIQMHGK